MTNRRIELDQHVITPAGRGIVMEFMTGIAGEYAVVWVDDNPKHWNAFPVDEIEVAR